jgi:hypothetical protein
VALGGLERGRQEELSLEVDEMPRAASGTG